MATQAHYRAAHERVRVFAVVCKKQDGRELPFQAYADEREAKLVAERLVAIGCTARVRRVRPRRESGGAAA